MNVMNLTCNEVKLSVKRDAKERKVIYFGKFGKGWNGNEFKNFRRQN